MLGLRCAVKEDLNATVSDMVYGTTIAIPGDMLVLSKSSVNTKETFANIRAKKSSRHANKKTCVHKDLKIANVYSFA